MFDETIKFKYSWRPYQEKVLKEVENYISDKKINIVAAPGSGKTILGLELARKLGNPVLILSPTITIKNQWIDRFITLFMPEGSQRPNWISDNIYNLKYLNSVTYQGLHYAYKKKKQKNQIEDEETDDEIQEENIKIDIDIKKYDLVAKIKEKKISTIILDEAHHLKSEWWQSLTKVIEELEDITIISLTATPPYDIEYGEWKKYSELCGEIDMEISVPELVQAKNLCPHQDYIYFSYPTKKEKEIIEKYEKNVETLIIELQNNNDFLEMIKNHKYVKETNNYIEEILEHTEFYSSMLIFLNATNIKIDKEKVNILGHNKTIPKFTTNWLEILLQNILFEKRSDFENYNQIIQNIEQKLKKLEAIEKNKIFLAKNSNLQKYFVNSLSKLDSINKIVETEYSNLKNDLRMVILTDFLRKEYLFEENIEIKKIGIFPIFLNLIKQKPDLSIAILTGSIFMIPNNKKEKLLENTTDRGIPVEEIEFIQVEKVQNYSIVTTSNKNRNILMKAISALFSKGDVNIIIGTKSLLGEGWDEPSINSLILASFVGSYVLSNQMRGRAIRTNNNIYKTSNVWHLVCVTKTENNIVENMDFEMLKRRFNAFVGIGYNKNVIESGIQRLDIIPKEFSKWNIDKYNMQIVQISNNRENMYNRWFELIEKFGASKIKITNQLETNKQNMKKNFSVIQVSKVLTFFLTYIFVEAIAQVILQMEEATRNRGMYQDIYLILAIVMPIIITIIINFSFVIQCIRAIRLSIPKEQLKTVAQVTTKSLCNAKIIKTSYNKIKITSIENKEDCNIQLCINGVTTHENNIIVNSLKEIFSDVENQRYILVNKKQRISTYYNVPSILSNKKELANYFYENWKNDIGKCYLIYTKSLEGRKMLLKARKNTFNYENIDKFIEKKKPLSEWE